jgi:hypothetical protein
MTDKPHKQDFADEPVTAKAVDGLKLDFNTIKIILLTACVVLALLSVPLFYLLRNFVTFDALDRYLKLTESVSPKILHEISEEVVTGYSKNFLIDSTHLDNTMLFFATKDQRVTLTINATPVEGGFQPLMLQLNGCSIGNKRIDEFHFYERDLTNEMAQCAPDEADLNTLKIILPDGPKKNSTVQVNCLVVVHQRVHRHLKDGE